MQVSKLQRLHEVVDQLLSITPSCQIANLSRAAYQEPAQATQRDAEVMMRSTPSWHGMASGDSGSALSTNNPHLFKAPQFYL